MEIHILDTLSWRMRSITPFSFLNFFVSFFELKEPTLTQTLKDRASEIIFDAQNGTTFSPSIFINDHLWISFSFFSLLFKKLENNPPFIFLILSKKWSFQNINHQQLRHRHLSLHLRSYFPCISLLSKLQFQLANTQTV